MTIKNTFLAIDTATGPCSVALWHEGHNTVYLENEHSSQQSAALIPMIEQALSQSNLDYDDLSAVLCTVGPGSFTGIRVGLAAASGICFAAKKPQMGFSTLETTAYGAITEANGANILAILNAGKGEVYYQAFATTPYWKALYPPNLGKTEEALTSISSPTIIAGNVKIDSSDYSYASIKFPQANALCSLAVAKVSDPKPFIPFYIRDPDATPMVLDK